MNEQQQRWLHSIQRELDQSVDHIDPVTLVRLRAIRREALERHSTRFNRFWLWLSGGTAATAVAGVLAFVLLSSVSLTPPPSAMDDIELLTAAEDMEFFDDLEFYQWLELGHDRSG